MFEEKKFDKLLSNDEIKSDRRNPDRILATSAYSHLIVIKVAGSNCALNYCCNSSYRSIGQTKFGDFYCKNHSGRYSEKKSLVIS